MKERRALGRGPVEWMMKPMPATFQTDRLLGPGLVVNLSGVWLFVATRNPPAPGESVRVSFRDAADNELEVVGTVRWSDPDTAFDEAGFGMEIDEPSEGYLELYEEMLLALGGSDE